MEGADNSLLLGFLQLARVRADRREGTDLDRRRAVVLPCECQKPWVFALKLDVREQVT